jgi:hypothetical protein
VPAPQNVLATVPKSSGLIKRYIQGGGGPLYRYLSPPQGTGPIGAGLGILQPSGGAQATQQQTPATYYIVMQNTVNPAQVRVQVSPTPVKVNTTVDNNFKVVANLSSTVGWNENSATAWATANATPSQTQAQSQSQTTNVTLSPTQTVTVNTSQNNPVVDLYEQPLAFMSGQFDPTWLGWAEGFFGPAFAEAIHAPSFSDLSTYIFQDAPYDPVGPNGDNSTLQ